MKCIKDMGWIELLGFKAGSEFLPSTYYCLTSASPLNLSQIMRGEHSLGNHRHTRPLRFPLIIVVHLVLNVLSLNTQLSFVLILCGLGFHIQLPPKHFIPSSIISLFNQKVLFVPLYYCDSYGYCFWMTATKFVTLTYSSCSFCSCHFLHLSSKLMYLGQSRCNLFLFLSGLPKITSSASHINMSYGPNIIFENSSPST